MHKGVQFARVSPLLKMFCKIDPRNWLSLLKKLKEVAIIERELFIAPPSIFQPWLMFSADGAPLNRSLPINIRLGIKR